VTTAIEELEKLVDESFDDYPDQDTEYRHLIYAVDRILALLPRLRAEAREWERAAFVAGRVWANEWFAMPTADWQESTEAEALRRYKEV